MKLSIIVPVLNEAAVLADVLGHLQAYRAAGHQLIVVDGGSVDAGVQIAAPLADVVLASQTGRALQMNSGARAATGDWLLFLHADTRLPDNVAAVTELIEQNRSQWGRFDVRLSGAAWPLRIIEWCMNWRSRLTAIATGDQAIFVRRTVFNQLKGFAPQPLMEDIELCRRLRRVSAPLCLRIRVITSSRRWEEQGMLRTILLMWRLRLGYFLGVAPERLVKRYYLESSE